MRFQVRTVSGKAITADAGESILDAAERCGVNLEYSCRTGRCNTCKARVASGSTVALAPELGLTDTEMRDGWVLTCVRTPAQDVVLSADSELNLALPPVRTVPCRVDSIKAMNADVIEVVLRLPPSRDWSFRPGQHVELIGRRGVRRCYSLADRGGVGNTVSLHVRRIADGEFSAYWFEEAAADDLLRFRGPLGTFFFRGRAGARAVFLATGTGVAPVKAILEELAETDRSRAVDVYVGGRTPEDLYWHPPQHWPPKWKFVPVLSRPRSDWGGRSGYVQDVMLEDLTDLSTAELYACGSEAMVQDARDLALRHGLEVENFFADSFVSSAPVVRAGS